MLDAKLIKAWGCSSVGVDICIGILRKCARGQISRTDFASVVYLFLNPMRACLMPNALFEQASRFGVRNYVRLTSYLFTMS